MIDFFVFMPLELVSEALLLAVPFIATAIFIATLAAPGPRSVSLVVISAIMALATGIAYYQRFRNNQLIKKSEDSYGQLKKLLYKVFRPLPIYFALMHSTAIVYFIIIIIRLEATDTFGGSPQYLDFGPKVSSGKIYENNISMTNSASTFGHFLQGFLASFISFPAIAGIISRIVNPKNCSDAEPKSESVKVSNTKFSSILGRKPRIIVMTTLQLLTACMTIYPSYSGIKRFVKDGDDFSRTSHSNNVTEWLLGYCLGMGIGWFVTVLIQSYLFEMAGLNTNGAFSTILCCSGGADENNANDESKIQTTMDLLDVLPGSGPESGIGGGERKYGFGYVEEYQESCSPRMSMAVAVVSHVRTALLVLLSASCLTTGIYMGKTWGVGKDALSEDMIVLFVGIYVVVTGVMVWFSTKRWPFNLMI